MEKLLFKNRSEFRAWLMANVQSGEGVWLIFGKKGGPKTLSSGEALEEALCFGWINGLMESNDETSYIMYFKQRSDNSNWSDKNKSLIEKLEAAGLMTDDGRAKVETAKKNGCWNPVKPEPLTDEQFKQFEEMLKPYELAYSNFIAMPKSARKTYTASYYYTKTDVGRQKRLDTILERLNLNLNPMESMKKA
jgi:uncharacterized protein YdeI (YjbR/CyaY-like superfamily)